MTQKLFSRMVLTLLAICTIFFPFGSVKALTTMKVEPHESLFSTDTTHVGDRFNVSVWIYDVNMLFAAQVHLTVDEALLNITNAWLPTWNSSWIFYGKTTIRPQPGFRDLNDNNVIESVIIGDSLLLGSPITGNGLLAVIEFAILYEPTENQVSCQLDINSIDTYILDDFLNEVSILTENGYYEYAKVGFRHDVAVINITPQENTIGHGLTLGINVTVENQGDFVESFNVTAYVNATQIQRVEVLDLANRTTKRLVFMWNTQSFVRGSYTISATADVVTNETDIYDNSHIDGVVAIGLAIHSITWTPTSPPPYVPSQTPRVHEPVRIEVNITDPDVAKVHLMFRKLGEWWFNTSMTFNATEELWIQTIPGTVENCTIEFFIEVHDGFGLTHTSSLLSYYVKSLLPGDLNGDGKVDIWDVGYVAKHFGDIET